ncbi:hypothetical protein GQ53DRAFT_741182 [Thozetella sp. PMI_491]|nr:hypothetical protein GQ53DRAFT_741182 [Thozetella sp. PMI_491]
MARFTYPFLRRWHRMLSLKIQPPGWYPERLREETQEVARARGRVHRLSERSDILFCIVRAHFDGFPLRKIPPIVLGQNGLVYAYMVAKFTSRWGFYRFAAHISAAPDARAVSEVINPAKQHKIREVASRHNIDMDKFASICRYLRHFWPLFP